MKHKTAIPAGTYKVICSYSPKFLKVTPLLLDVPLFDFIRMHWGNSHTDTSGCILVGNTLSAQANRPLQHSRDAFGALMMLLDKWGDEGHEITIEIINTKEIV